MVTPVSLGGREFGEYLQRQEDADLARDKIK
jgi:hypothetical protein